MSGTLPRLKLSKCKLYFQYLESYLEISPTHGKFLPINDELFDHVRNLKHQISSICDYPSTCQIFHEPHWLNDFEDWVQQKLKNVKNSKEENCCTMTAFKKNGLSLKNFDYATNYEKVLDCGLSQRSEELDKKRESFYPYLLTTWTNLNRAKLALGEF